MRHEHEGGGRRPRFFGHGDLRLVILDILTRNASHGYELIKEIENLTQGNYTPSPGVICPGKSLHCQFPPRVPGKLVRASEPNSR